MKITSYQIAAFAAVGKELSFSNAAISLGLSQSAITQHINALELVIGTRLLVRSRSGCELTRAGQDLFILATRYHALHEQINHSARQYTDMDKGNLSICISTPRPAMSIISEFQRRYPEIDVEIVMSPWEENLSKLSTREVDLSIVVEPGDLEGLMAVEIERRPFVAIVPPDHALARRKRISIADLEGETLVLLSDSSYTMKFLSQRFYELGFTPHKAIMTTGYDMLLEAVIHHIGVSIILDGSLTAIRGVHRLTIKEFTEQHGYYAVSHEENRNFKTVSSFFEIIEDGQQDLSPWKTSGTRIDTVNIFR
jgi:LysR family transcriptional regulator, low CO2-responsive transcriptional regulator